MQNHNKTIVHVRNMQKAFKEQVDNLREDIKIIEDPQCKAMFETAAEVLLGLIKAFEDYERKEESAWK
jgi:archaellum component FlaG (FlaF/FlaG flagellin family)